MSARGRRVVAFDFEARWEAGHRAGRVHPFERKRIVDGDWSPIVREVKPDFTEGQEFVLSWSRASRQAMYDDCGNLTGEVVCIPRLPLFVITIRDVKRHRLGHFRVRYDIVDKRDPSLLMRRTPPALREGEYTEASEEEIRQAAIESAYTSNPKQSVEGFQVVPPDWQNRFSVQATSRFAEHKREQRAEQANAADLRRINAELRELAKRAAKMGIDPVQVLAPVAREISAQHAGLKDAA